MAETVSMPKLGFDMAEGTLIRWVRKEGEPVNKGDVLAEIETDKATVEVESSASGIVRRLLVDEGTVVPVNTPIAVVGEADEVIGDQELGNKESGKQEKVESGEQKVENRSLDGNRLTQSPISNPQSSIVRASPLAKKIARDQGLDLGRIQGSGPGGRIVRKDIERAMSSKTVTPGIQPSSVAGRSSSPGDETIPLSKLRQAIARRMTEAKTTIPHFYVTSEYKMDSLLDLRRQFNNLLPEGEKVSVNDFIVKAAALALRQFPNLNASLDGNSILRHAAVDIGVAVSVEGGLLTVVCKDADAKPLRQIAAEVKAMAGRAREGKVKPEDIEGSTFSVSNLGMYDVENFTAIINPPEAAILAIGSARELPVVENGIVKTGWRMKATLSVDHRVSDGAEAAKFMQALRVYLEEPVRLVV